MGKPENEEEFILFQADDIQVYLAREIWEKLEPGTKRLRFAIGGYGRFNLEFDPADPPQSLP